jgi:imidazolonepropionase
MLDLLVTGIGQLVTAQGAGLHRGRDHGQLQVLEQAALGIKDGIICWVGSARAGQAGHGEARNTVDLGGRAVIPGLIDPHTHLVWAGDRLADFEARAAGVGYEAILAAGGGIRRTVQLTQAASAETLLALALPRLLALVASGATTIEIKSGYGFTLEAELKLLRVIRALQTQVAAQLIPTLLIHVPPQAEGERRAYVEMVVEQLIPAVAAEGLAQTLDVFVEREAFSLAETRRMIEAAEAQAWAIKLHVDQFHAIGGLELGIAHRALSLDHLEASGPAQVEALAASNSVGVILPGVSLHLGLPAAPARQLIDSGAAVAIGTDLNPGSSPVFSMQLALALGVRLNHLTPAEALIASTVHGAAALGLADRGRLEVGCRADFLALDGNDWREVAYTLGRNPIAAVFIAGASWQKGGKHESDFHWSTAEHH